MGQLNDLTVRNLVVVGSSSLPAGSVTAANIAAGANMETSKLVHRHVLNFQQAEGASMADATVPIFIARATTLTIVAIEIAVTGAAAVGDSTVTVDLKLGNAGGAFTTALSGVITIDNATALRTPVAGTLITTSGADGNILQLVIDATVGTGTLPQGLIKIGRAHV